MADCNDTALFVDLTFTNLVVFTREGIKTEAALATASIFGFFPLIGLYADMLSKLRVIIKDQLGALNSALVNHATCWSNLGFTDCFETISQIRNGVLKLQDDPHPEFYKFVAEVERLQKLYRESTCGAVTVVPLTSPDEFEAAENVDLELHFHGRFGSGPQGQYTVPASQQARPQKVRHKLQPKPGGGGPTLWVECTVFDIETWKVGAEATMLGAAVSSEGPFTFEWTFDGVVVQGANAPTSSTMELVVPTLSKPRRLGVKATSKSGLVLEHAVIITTRATREDCSAADVPFLLPTMSLIRTRA